LGSHQAVSSTVVRFGGKFELDRGAYELRKAGRPLRLARIPMELLLLLLEQPDQLVSRERIAERIWGKGVFLDIDNGINAVVRRIRLVLEDDPEHPRFIQTVVGRGYRFIAPVQETAPSPAVLPAAVAHIAESSRYEQPIDMKTDLQRPEPHSESGKAVPSGVAILGRSRRMIAVSAGAFVIVIVALIAGRWFTPSRGKIESIAVLPFANASGDSNMEYLSDGITESLINSLSQLPSLKVMSRDSVFRYRGKETDARAAGHELGVGAVLTGRIVQHGGDLWVSTELVDAHDNTHIWGEKYNRKLADLLSVQQEIVQQITDKLMLRLNGEERTRLTKRYTDNIEAYQLYLKGRYYWNRRPRGLLDGIKYFEQAIEIDPNYALAYSGLADCYAALATWEGGTISPAEAMLKGNAAALKAVEFDETLAEAHASLGYIRLHYDWNWPEAEKQFKRAIELNSRYATAHHWYSHYLMTAGQTEASLAESRLALELDPLDLIISGHQPWHYYYARDFDRVIEICHDNLASHPEAFWVHFELGRAYEQKRMFNEAISELTTALSLQKDMTFAIAALGHAYAVSGQREKAQQLLGNLKKLSTQRYVSSADIAMIYIGLGDNDQALAWLQKAFLERSWYFVLLRVDPRLDSLRPDPRFQALLRRVNLPPISRSPN
jgi:TolB-like protein/DNA-binding winged helix-turn-helix (wHTH) protein/Tfp pilus assembly protein PilF